jgi:hypothetical protein
MAIIISEGGRNARRIEETPIVEESYLQDYICANPESIPFNDIKEDIKLLIVAKEFGLSAGSADAIAVDDEGNIYVVETKLFKNPDKRHVIAQVLDYGASLWRDYRDPEEFIGDLDGHVKTNFGLGLRQKLQDHFGLDGQQVSDLLVRLKENLKTGTFRFVVLMDKLHEELKDLIVFMNQSSKFAIFAVEMKYYKHDRFEVIIPKLFGAESVLPPPSLWNQNRFFEDVIKQKSLTSEQKQAVRTIYDFVTDKNDKGCKADKIIWGKGKVTGSFSPRWDWISRLQPLTVYSDGKLQINFAFLGENESTRQFREKFKVALEKIEGFRFPENYQDRFPLVSAETWAPVVDRFIQTMRDLVSH